MKFLKLVTQDPTAKYCNFDARNLNNVNRSTDERLTGDMAEISERRLNALRAAAPTVALSLDVLSEQIRPALTVKTFHGSRLRLRDDSGKIVSRMPNGSRVRFMGETKLSRDADGQSIDTDVPPDGSLNNRHLWFKINCNGQIGWASAEYLEGSLNAIPIEPVTTTPEVVIPPEEERPPVLDETPEEGSDFGFDIPEIDLGDDTPFYRAPAAAALERITDNNRAQAATSEAIRSSAEYERTSAQRAVSGSNVVPDPINDAERVIPLPVDEQIAKISVDTEVPPDRVRAMLMDLSRWDESKILADPEGFRAVVEDMNARYGEDFAKFAPRAMDVAPALAFFKSPAIRPIIGKWLPAIGGGLLWTRIARSEGSDWTTFHAPDERWNTGNIAVDTGAYFVPIAGNFKDYRDAQLEWREGSYGMAAISVASGTLGMVLDGVSIATAWTGVGFAAGQGARMGVKTGLRGLKAGIRYLGRDTARSVWDVMTFRALRPSAAATDAATATLRGQRAAEGPETGSRSEYESSRTETEVVARPEVENFREDPRFHESANVITRNLRESEVEGSFIYEGAVFKLEKNADTNLWQAVDTHGNRLDLAKSEDIPSMRENILQRSLDFYDKSIMPRIQSQIDAMPALLSRLKANIRFPQRFKRQAENVTEKIKGFEWGRLNLMGAKNRQIVETARQAGETEFKAVRVDQAQHNLDQARQKLASRSGGLRRLFSTEKGRDKLAAKVNDAEAELNRVRSAEPETLVREHENNSWWRSQLNELGHRVGDNRFLNRGARRAELVEVNNLRTLNTELGRQEAALRRLEAERDALPNGSDRRAKITDIENLQTEINTSRKNIEDQVSAMYNRQNTTETQQVLNDRINELRGQMTQSNNPNRIRTIRQEIDALESYRLANPNPKLSELRSKLTVGNKVRLTAPNGQKTEFNLAEAKSEIDADGNSFLILRSEDDGSGNHYLLKVETEGSHFKVTNLRNADESFTIDKIEDIPQNGRRTTEETNRIYDSLEAGSVLKNRDDPSFKIEITAVNNSAEGLMVSASVRTSDGSIETITGDMLKSRLSGYLANERIYVE